MVLDRRAGVLTIAVSIVTILVALMGCSAIPPKASTRLAVSRSVEGTVSLLGNWEPQTLVEQPPQGKAVLGFLEFTRAGLLTAQLAITPSVFPAQGTWTSAGPDRLSLRLDGPLHKGTGVYRFRVADDLLSLTFISGDKWATGIATSTVTFKRVR